MAVVNEKSTIFRDELAGGDVIDAGLAKGREFHATGSVSNAATDSAASTYKIADLPADAILSDRTFFDVQNDGFAQIQIGTLTDATALVNQTKATENIITPIVNGDANHGLPLWQVLGLSENPGGFIGIYKHAAAGATGAGSMPFRLSWLA